MVAPIKYGSVAWVWRNFLSPPLKKGEASEASRGIFRVALIVLQCADLLGKKIPPSRYYGLSNFLVSV